MIQPRMMILPRFIIKVPKDFWMVKAIISISFVNLKSKSPIGFCLKKEMGKWRSFS